MFKKYIFLVFVSLLIMVETVVADCTYQEQWNDCRQKNNFGQPLAVTDYLCVQSVNNEEILYNIILDQEFKKVDEEVMEFLNFLSESKNYFFWTAARASYFQWVDLIWVKFKKYWEFWEKYNAICDASRPDSISLQVLECMQTEETIQTRVQTENAKEFLSASTCIWLAERKLLVFETVAYDVLKANKAYIRKDNRKRFMQSQRSSYNNLVESMRINITYMQRIWKKWTSKTKNASDA